MASAAEWGHFAAAVPMTLSVGEAEARGSGGGGDGGATGDWRAFYDSGLTYTRKGMHDFAIRDFTRAIQIKVRRRGRRRGHPVRPRRS